jgi:phosphatidylglycerol:prolipoprotein diacylglycerol transferase
MLFSLQALAMLLPGYIRVGGLHVPVYGLFAALGLVAALWLSQRTAVRVGIIPGKLWDAGVFAVVAAFIASRVLLIAFDLHSFLKFPLLMLALPSLTYGGMLLTGLMVWAWLRWKRLPVLDALDAWAPCGMALAAVMSIGHFVEGTDAGMPTRMPWGIVTPGDTMLGRVHPVQIYAALGWLVMCFFLLRDSRPRRFSGEVFALALFEGGLFSILLDHYRQPRDTYGTSWLEPGQLVATTATVIGAAIFVKRRLWPPQSNKTLTRDEVASILEGIVAGRAKGLEHVDIEYGTFSDPLLLELQQQFAGLHADLRGGSLVRKESNRIFLEYARQLRGDAEQPKKELV